MKTPGRFDWDILLEQDPANPPVKREAPPPPEPEEKLLEEPDAFQQEAVVLPPPTPEVQLQPKPVQASPKSNQTTNRRQLKPKNLNDHYSGQAGILQGNLTPHGILNAFVLAELLNKPKGLRHRYQPRFYR